MEVLDHTAGIPREGDNFAKLLMLAVRSRISGEVAEHVCPPRDGVVREPAGVPGAAIGGSTDHGPGSRRVDGRADVRDEIYSAAPRAFHVVRPRELGVTSVGEDNGSWTVENVLDESHDRSLSVGWTIRL